MMSAWEGIVIPLNSRWKERDSRFERFVVVRERNSRTVTIESETFHRRTGVRTEAFLKRFSPAPDKESR